MLRESAEMYTLVGAVSALLWTENDKPDSIKTSPFDQMVGKTQSKNRNILYVIACHLTEISSKM